MQKKRTRRTGQDKEALSKKRKRTSAPKGNSREAAEENVASTRRPELIGVALVAIGLISMCGLCGFNAGYIGYYFARCTKYFFGIGAHVFSLLFIVAGGYYIMKHRGPGISKATIGVGLLLASLLGLYHHMLIPAGEEILPKSLADGGGLLGGLLTFILHKPLGDTGTPIVLGAMAIGSILVATPWSLAKGILATKEQAEKGAVVAKDMAEIALDNTRQLGAKVHQQVGEQVERLRNNNSFYNQANDGSFINDSPDMSAGKQEGQVSDIQPIIKNGTGFEPSPDDPPQWNAPDAILPSQRIVFDTPDESGVFAHGTAVPADNNNVGEFNSADTITASLQSDKLAAQLDELQIDTAQLPKSPVRDANPIVLTEDRTEPESMAQEIGFSDADISEEDSGHQFYFDVDKDTERVQPEETEDDKSVNIGDNANRTLDDYLVEQAVGDETDISDESDDDESGFTIEFSSDNEGSAQIQELPDDDGFEEEPQANVLDQAVQDEFVAALSTINDVSAHNINNEPAPAPYVVPDIKDILSKHQAEVDEALEQEINEKAKVLKQTLIDFKVKAEILSACHGPAVTRYEVKLAPGVKVNKLTGLADDIALSMAATSVRIEQIPNRNTIGIEVPNRKLESVQLRDVLENPAFEEAKSKLTVGFGKDISGKAIFANLADMPHLLVAGATGSGKSVCINTLVTSILFKAKPDEVKFIMIDPKMVELSVYNDIPHQMVPVVTDSRKAASVLNWAVQEMEKRYKLIAEVGAKKIEVYNSFFKDDKARQLPSIVIIIDELADLMMVAPHDVEDAICRLAQKARAAGIYLVLATQRPSVNVITGVIKANIPSRISFAVTSQIDSRTILDAAGAEKLLGKGDMLFKPQSEPKARRVQGAFVSDQEVEALVEYIKAQGHKLEVNQEIIDFTNKAEQSEVADETSKTVKSNVDELLRDAVELVVSSGKASASTLQRRYRIGFSRAGRLMDTMEQLKIVGPQAGSKPREILVTPDQAFEIMDNLEELMKEAK